MPISSWVLDIHSWTHLNLHAFQKLFGAQGAKGHTQEVPCWSRACTGWASSSLCRRDKGVNSMVVPVCEFGWHVCHLQPNLEKERNAFSNSHLLFWSNKAYPSRQKSFSCSTPRVTVYWGLKMILSWSMEKHVGLQQCTAFLCPFINVFFLFAAPEAVHIPEM